MYLHGYKLQNALICKVKCQSTGP